MDFLILLCTLNYVCYTIKVFKAQEQRRGFNQKIIKIYILYDRNNQNSHE